MVDGVSGRGRGPGGVSNQPQLALTPMSSEYGTYKTVKARFRPWLSDKDPEYLNVFPLRSKSEGVQGRGPGGGAGTLPASEQGGNTLKGLKDNCLKAKAIFWP